MSEPGPIARWLAPTAGHSLAAFRILFGIYLFCYFGQLRAHVPLLFSSQGVYVPFAIPDLAPPPLVAWALYAGLMSAIVAFVAGIRTRAATFSILALYLWFYFLNLAVKNTAYDRLNLIFLVILCFAKTDAVWTLRAKARQPSFVSSWPVHLIRLQMALLYLGSGLWKVNAPHWHEGEMLRMTLAGPWGTDLAAALVAVGWPLGLYAAATWGVIALEVLMPVLLYSRRLQPLGFAIGFAFHLGNWLLLGLPEFMNCVTTYVLFLSPERVRALGGESLAWISGKARALAEQ